MKQKLPEEYDSHSASQEITHNLRKPKNNYHMRKIPP
jgi:hypothetical protein